MSEEKTIQQGSKVKFDYTLTVEGKVEDTSTGRGPLEYTHGAGQIIKGLENFLEGKTVGYADKVTIPAKEAYGEVLEEAVRRVPKSAINGAEHLKEGDMVGASNGGHTFRAIVKKIDNEKGEIVLDFNHPLAGKDLTFDVKVVEIN